MEIKDIIKKFKVLSCKVMEAADNKVFPTEKWLRDREIDCDVLFSNETFDVTYGNTIQFRCDKGNWTIKASDEILYNDATLLHLYTIHRTAFGNFERNLEALKEDYINQKKVDSEREIQKLEAQRNLVAA
jgi:hypothetical protein